MSETLFDPGMVVITNTFQTTCHNGEIDEAEMVRDYLEKHVTGDWGDCCPEDKKVNDDALKTGNRIMSVYTLADDSKTRFWVITEWDRSVTTFLLPEDY
jgi:hypothetical protein